MLIVSRRRGDERVYGRVADESFHGGIALLLNPVRGRVELEPEDYPREKRQQNTLHLSTGFERHPIISKAPSRGLTSGRRK